MFQPSAFGVLISKLYVEVKLMIIFITDDQPEIKFSSVGLILCTTWVSVEEIKLLLTFCAICMFK